MQDSFWNSEGAFQFYAGVPIVVGFDEEMPVTLGTLCIMDTEPRSAFEAYSLIEVGRIIQQIICPQGEVLRSMDPVEILECLQTGGARNGLYHLPTPINLVKLSLRRLPSQGSFVCGMQDVRSPFYTHPVDNLKSILNPIDDAIWERAKDHFEVAVDFLSRVYGVENCAIITIGRDFSLRHCKIGNLSTAAIASLCQPVLEGIENLDLESLDLADVSSYPCIATPDMNQHEHLRNHPAANNPPHIKFFAGVPLMQRDTSKSLVVTGAVLIAHSQKKVVLDSRFLVDCAQTTMRLLTPGSNLLQVLRPLDIIRDMRISTETESSCESSSESSSKFHKNNGNVHDDVHITTGAGSRRLSTGSVKTFWNGSLPRTEIDIWQKYASNIPIDFVPKVTIDDSSENHPYAGNNNPLKKKKQQTDPTKSRVPNPLADTTSSSSSVAARKKNPPPPPKIPHACDYASKHSDTLPYAVSRSKTDPSSRNAMVPSSKGRSGIGSNSDSMFSKSRRGPLFSQENKGTKIDGWRNWFIPESEIEFGAAIGQGSSATVFGGVWRGCGVAIKVAEATENRAKLQEELSILASLRHPSILLFMGALAVEESSLNNPGHVALVTEICYGGTLFEVLHTRDFIPDPSVPNPVQSHE